MAEDGCKKGPRGRKKTADAGEKAGDEAHGQKAKASAVNAGEEAHGQKAEADLPGEAEGKARKRRKKGAADPAEAAPEDEPQLKKRGQSTNEDTGAEAEVEVGKGRKRKGEGPGTALDLLHILAQLTPTFPPNIQTKATAFHKEVAALIGKDVD